MTAPGHVFVTRSDMRQLVCDAWSLPCDLHRSIVPHWVEDTTPPVADLGWIRERCDRVATRYADHRYQPRADAIEAVDDWSMEGRRVTTFRTWPAELAPRPWLVNVGAGDRTTAWYVDGVVQYLEAANARLAGQPGRFGRERPLVAVHAVGTGMGGASARKAEVIFAQLGAMLAFAARPDCAVDQVFVAFDESTFAAAQACRRRLSATHDLWQPLTAAQRDTAGRLARRASKGNLVLFLGAGVSMPAGLPDWNALLREVAAPHPDLVDSLDALDRLDPLDRAQIVEHHAPDLRERVCRRLAVERYALGHSLLARLPVAEVVTQNFDALFERACAHAGAPVSTIPGSRVADEKRWLLKMHGSIDDPSTIVLTRADYLRYLERRAALSGIVQALLITKHMLFVGFSLQDPNFHRIADDVRKVLRTTDTEAGAHDPFGSVLLLAEDRLRRTLWHGDLDLVPMDHEGPIPPRARHLEIFLDHLLYACSSSASYLLDPTFEHALEPAERDLRDALLALERRFGRALKGTPSWDAVRRLLAELGREEG